MFVPGLVHGTSGGRASRIHPFSLHADSVDLFDINGNGWGVPLEHIIVSEVGANGSSSLSFRYEDPRNLHAIPAAARIRFNRITSVNPTVEEPQFAGYITGRTQAPDEADRGYTTDITCTDLSIWLDYHVVPAFKHKAGASDRTLIQAVVAAAMRSNDINTHSGFVTSTNSNMEAVDFSHMTLRAAVEAIGSLAGEDRHYYVDFLGRLHYYSGVEAGTPAPYTIVQTTPSPGGSRASESLRVEYDDRQIATAVYIIGATAAGTGWVKDEVAIKRYGLRQATFEAPHSKTVNSRNVIGAHFLKLHKDPIVRGQFEQAGTDTGWRVGQSVVITNVQLGLAAASYPIRQIDTTFDGGAGHSHRIIYFGELPARGGHRMPIPAGTGTPVTTAPPPGQPKVADGFVGSIGHARSGAIL